MHGLLTFVGMSARPDLPNLSAALDGSSVVDLRSKFVEATPLRLLRPGEAQMTDVITILSKTCVPELVDIVFSHLELPRGLALCCWLGEGVDRKGSQRTDEGGTGREGGMEHGCTHGRIASMIGAERCACLSAEYMALAPMCLA